ncbi:MAG: ABC transporter ATP-binding protein [Verrucomicrobiota bacterium]
MPAPASMLKLAGVKKQFAVAEGAPVLPVLNGVDLEVRQGESLAIIGPSGSGKSTLLNLMGTLDRPDAGEVWLAGQNLAALNDLDLAALRSEKIGFIFQSHHLLPHCSVWENVLVPTLALRVKPDAKTIQSRAEKILQRVGLSERLQHRPGQLSGGERQRVAVARALINQPGLILADEPTGALDRANATSLVKLLADLNREDGVTLIMVTHAPALARMMGRVLELKDGKLQ